MVRKLLIPALVAILVLTLAQISTAARYPQVAAAGAVAVDVETGQVLYDKNMHLKRPPASTTKVLTAIIALEEGNNEDIVTVSRKAAYQEGSSIYLEVGEKISLVELVYGVLLASGNDAAVAIAEHISGSVEEFAVLMNKRASEMGALNSNFLNPSGLPEAGHYSTSFDLAMIMRYALHNETFASITATKYKKISWAKYQWGRGLRNHNKLLWSYPGATGGKTGYTRAAGRCLISSARRNGREVVAVVLNSSNDWLECSALLDYGLDNFNSNQIIRQGEIIYTLNWQEAREKELDLMAGDNVQVVVPNGKQLKIKKEIIIDPQISLPLKKGDRVGRLNVYQEDYLINSIELLAGRDLNFNSLFMRFWHKLTIILD